MSISPHDPRNAAVPAGPAAPEEFDPAHAELARALGKAFAVLKVVMLVLVVLYFMSGFFSVKEYERGVVLRFGQIVGGDGPDAVKGPGWHWSLPFPIDQWQTVAVSERELPLEFMLELTESERATGKILTRYSTLAPERDDYLVTGDANILHANLLIKYRIDNVVDYVTNVYPATDPNLDIMAAGYKRYPEYNMLRALSRDAVIATAARFGALDIRGSKQNEFMLAVARTLRSKLAELATKGTPLGIYVDENSGVIGPKSKTGTLEAILPPRQVQEVFDQVFSAQTQRGVEITKAKSEAESLLVSTVGPVYDRLSNAVDAEYEYVRKLSNLESAASPDRAAIDTAKAELKARREATEALLRDASGVVRSIVLNADIERDQIVKEASGDYNRYLSIVPEYRRNPQIFTARLVDEMRRRAYSSSEVVKVYVPEDAKQYRLQIARAGKVIKSEEERRREDLEKKKKEMGLTSQTKKHL